jgi:hypothetical protein
MSSKPVDAAEEKDAIQRNARIEKVLKNDKKVMDRTIKILLLGEYEVRYLNHVYTYRLFLRCWRIGQVDYYQTDAHHSCGRVS